MIRSEDEHVHRTFIGDPALKIENEPSDCIEILALAIASIIFSIVVLIVYLQYGVVLWLLQIMGGFGLLGMAFFANHIRRECFVDGRE